MLASPCINLCQMDADSGLCLGCLRTLNEIILWARTDDSTRAAILAAIAERRQQPLALGDEHGAGEH